MKHDELRSCVEVIRGQLDLIRSELGEEPSDKEIRNLAESFCAMDDDCQAKFFVEVAAVMDGWPAQSHGRDQQCWYIGRHLATCTCSTEAARDVIRTIASAIGYDRIRQLEGELATERARSRARWQPISTAPKDGTYVLVAGDSGYITTPLRVEVCRYDAEYRPRSPWVNHANDCFEEGGEPPTLWMPLPEGGPNE
jgi:hypothetical protein